MTKFSSAREIYFIDSQVSDVPTLLLGLPQRAEVHLLEAGADGLDQMLATLCERAGLDAIHLLSHAEPGRLALGGAWLTLETLEARAADFARLGQALSVGGDLLFYGCELASGDAGQAFVARIAQLTGANVAASQTLTGAAALGGDWELGARIGQVGTRTLAIDAYPGVLAASTIAGLTAVELTEGDAPVAIDQGVTFTGGFGFAGGSITFAVSDAMAGDQLRLTDAADGDVLGAITIDAGVVYLGNGAGRDAVATVDATENGEDGAALTIHFTAQDTAAVDNPGFESGLTGWTIGDVRVELGTTVINGLVTPNDPTSPSNTSGDANPDGGFTYNHQVSSEYTEGAASLRLYNGGTTGAGFDVVHGPYAYSNTFAAEAGDTFHFDWKAAAGSDAYDAFGYLTNSDGSQTIIVIDETGSSGAGLKPWTTESVTVPTDGDWFFVFVAGTYDYSGGMAAGGSLFVDNFRVERSPVNDAVIKTITSQVTYENTADNPPADRELTITVTDGAGDSNELGADLTIDGVQDGMTGGVSITGTAEQGETLTAVSTLTDPDDLGALVYQWQRGDGAGGWTDISGADGATYELTQADVGVAVRVAVSYVDGGGESESAESTATAAVADASFAPTGNVNLAGTVQQGQSLTASNTIVDPDGVGAVSYQWQREDGAGGWEDITGATGATYRLTQADVGLEVRAVASYTDGDGTDEVVEGAATAPVANGDEDPTGGVTISGTVREGRTLTAADTLDDADGMGTVTYQWRADGVDVSGATGATFTLTGAHVGKAISVVASYTDGDGNLESVASTATAQVDPRPSNPPPPPTTTPVIDGVPVQTQTGLSPEGTPTQTITIPVVTPSRPEQVGDNTVADIPLVTTGGAPLLTAQLPTGIGLQVSGSSGPLSAGNALLDLIRRIEAKTVSGSTDQTMLTGGGSGFLADLAGNTSLLVQTIVPTTASGAAAPTTPLVISGTPAGGPATALVIDTRSANGVHLELQNVEFAAVIGAATITGGAGQQHVWGDGASQNIFLGADDDVLHGGAGADTVGSADGNDKLYGDEGDDIVFGGEGDDFLHGNAGADTTNGDIGSDIVLGGKGADRVWGDAGDDQVFGDADNDFVHGNAGSDTVNGGEGSDSVFGGQDNDMVFGDAGDDIVFGDKGDDFVQGNAGADTLAGGEGSDLLHGGKDADHLSGGDGNDTLSGDAGDDVLVGGAGADRFMTYAGGGADRVLDFSLAQGDRIYVEPGSTYTLVQQGADTVIDMGAGARLTLEGVQLSSLGDGWIIGG